MTYPMFGAVRNGERVPLTVADWTGCGSLSTVDGVDRVTFVGPAPRSLPCAVVVDGEHRQGVAKSRSEVSRAITVLELAPAVGRADDHGED